MSDVIFDKLLENCIRSCPISVDRTSIRELIRAGLPSKEEIRTELISQNASSVFENCTTNNDVYTAFMQVFDTINSRKSVEDSLYLIIQGIKNKVITDSGGYNFLSPMDDDMLKNACTVIAPNLDFDCYGGCTYIPFNTYKHILQCDYILSEIDKLVNHDSDGDYGYDCWKLSFRIESMFEHLKFPSLLLSDVQRDLNYNDNIDASTDTLQLEEAVKDTISRLINDSKYLISLPILERWEHKPEMNKYAIERNKVDSILDMCNDISQLCTMIKFHDGATVSIIFTNKQLNKFKMINGDMYNSLELIVKDILGGHRVVDDKHIFSFKSDTNIEYLSSFVRSKILANKLNLMMEYFESNSYKIFLSSYGDSDGY